MAAPAVRCERDSAGPFNSMFAWDAKKGRNERVGFRYCYTWGVYLAQLEELKRKYGVRTVLLATDDADGKVTGRLPLEKGFNWAFLHYPRQQFKKRGWMEFRKDLTEDVPFSLAAALEMLAFKRGDARGIVAAIFKTFERIHQLLCNRLAPENADNPAHADQYPPNRRKIA